MIPAEFRRFPSEWSVLPFSDVVKDVTSGNTKVPKGNYLEKGDYSIVDQGQQLYGGYSNDSTDLFNGSIPAIVFGDHTRAFKYIEEPFCLGADGAKVLEPKIENVHKRFLFHYLKQIRIESAGYSRHFKFLKETYIPLPPLDEQKRIAAILDKADAIRRKRQQAIQLADDFLRSVFLDMFGDPVTNPKGWEKKPLVELATRDKRAIVDGPFGASLKTDEYTEIGVPVIRINNIHERKFVNANFKYITEDKYEELKRSSVKKNDVLVARVGHTIGKACVFDQEFAALLSTTGVCKITCEQSKIHHGFLEALWANRSFQKYIKGFAKGAGQPYYNLTTIKGFEIIKPPLELQHRYIEISQQVAFAIGKSEYSDEHLENLFHSLSQKAFAGEL